MNPAVAVVSVAAPLAAVIAAVAPAASAAQAQVLPVHDVMPLPAVETLPGCLDTSVGSEVGTETLDGQVVVTGNTVNFHGTDTLDYTVTFADGTVVTGTAVEHLTFVGTARGATVQNQVVQERRVIVDASGQVVGTVAIAAVSHVTYVDANGNGQPDPGEVTSGVDRFFVICG